MIRHQIIQHSFGSNPTPTNSPHHLVPHNQGMDVSTWQQTENKEGQGCHRAPQSPQVHRRGARALGRQMTNVCDSVRSETHQVLWNLYSRPPQATEVVIPGSFQLPTYQHVCTLSVGDLVAVGDAGRSDSVFSSLGLANCPSPQWALPRSTQGRCLVGVRWCASVSTPMYSDLDL